MKIFVDLDRTLFDTGRFVRLTWQLLEDTYGIDSTLERVNMKNFYNYTDDLYDYDFFAQIRLLALDETNVTSKITDYMKDQNLLYPDSLEGLAALTKIGNVSILTFGNERYQRLKLASVLGLENIPAIMVKEHKGNYLKEACKESCVLIDDKEIAMQMPKNVRFILFDHKQEAPMIDHGNYISTGSLLTAADILSA